MIKSLNIIPQYTEYNDSLHRYNKWFIKLRWFAISALIFYWLLLKYLPIVNLSQTQSFVIIISAITILVYNFYFLQTYKKNNFVNTPLKFSILQILLDLIVLSIIVYYSGGIEAPIFMFYIFHMIIASLILPTKLVYMIAVNLICGFTVLSLFEFYGIIPHQPVGGLYPTDLYNSEGFVFSVLVIFSFVLFISIMLTSKIADELYSRERQLRLALEEVHRAEESKQKYISAVVHELKSPIAAATSGIELVLGNYVGTISDDIRHTLERSKIRLKESIDNINNILRVSRFKLLNKIDEEELILSELITKIIEKVNPIAERKQIKINSEIKENITIIGDIVLLELVFSNLLGNAIKYTPKPGNIFINVKQYEKGIQIEMNDDGIGIPKKDIEKIFEEYYRASNVKDIEGTGTGLALVKQIVETHKGSIKIESPSDIGSHERPGTKVILNFNNE